MKNYLAIHIDTDFLVGTICADEENLSYPIRNGDDECFWLYFYNDPFSGNISFGKDNQKHCNQGETNYIGNFIELIESKNNTFQIGEYEYPVIELLRHSKIIEKLQSDFSTQTYESQDKIPTLLTFSLSINDLAKKTIVDYLKKQSFDIISYTIPLTELVCKYAIMNNNINFKNGDVVTFLEATNTNLHLTKLVFTTDYFLSDGTPEPKQGLGIDPRRRALLKHIVNKIGTMGVLSETQKEIEYKLMEPKTVDWLNALDMQTNDAPFPIVEALSKMPNQKKRVLVYKSKISEFTQSDIKLIVDTYKDYVNRIISQEVSAIVLLGNLFQNEIIKNKFQSLIPNDRLLVYTNRDIQNILSIYPKIDFNRYISEQGRIETRAEADRQRKAEEIAKEAAKAKANKDAADKAAAEAKKEKDKQEAQRLYEQAVKLDKDESLDDALVKIKDAILRDPERTEYPRFRDALNAKIKDRNDKTDEYQAWYKDAEAYEQSNDLENALKAYQYAQKLFDSAELRKKIVETERKIEKQTKETKINNFISIAIILADKGKFEDAISNINKALEIDPANKATKEALNQIYTLQHNEETKKQYKEIVNKADKFFKEQNFDNAIEQYNEALLLKTGDKHCTDQIAKSKELILQKQNREKADRIIGEANKFFQEELWEDAKAKYEQALLICPNDKNVQSKIKDCSDKIKAIEDSYKGLLFEATVAEKKKKLQEALSLLEQAKKIKPEDAELIERIKKIQNKMKVEDFEQNDAPAKTDNTKPPKENPETDNDGWDFVKKPEAKQDDFLGTEAKPNDFLGTETKPNDFLGTEAKQDDFLGTEAKPDDFLGAPKQEKKSDNRTKKKPDFDW
jgi:tetratricopeptide (TPR) repeat protein